MQVPIEISFRGVDHTDELDDLIREHAAGLDRVHDHVTSCHVTVEKPQEHQDSGRPWRVRLDITVPKGHEIVVRKEPNRGDMHEPLQSVIRDAFDAAERQLIELKEKQRRDVKSNAMEEAVGVVSRVFPEKGYGFITDASEQDIYFSANAVQQNEFERIREGTAVWYVAETGEKGLQAVSVRIHDQPSM